ncbi:MAG: sugar phosphate isomerase/epimerase family protein [bacterium]
MRIKGIGINAHPEHTGGEIENFERDLRFFRDVGYEYVEIPTDAVDVIQCGKLVPHQMKNLKAMLSSLNLKYTVHAPGALDLRDVDDLEVQKDLFRACIEFTSEIGAEIFVYHYNQKTQDPNLEQALLQGISEMADYATSKGVQICVENVEIDTVQNVVDFVQATAKESIRMTFDFAHAYLASIRFGFDFLESVRLAKPYIRHIHVQDNFGRFEELRLAGYDQYKLIPYRRLLALGKGDLHLPPGWGVVPLDAALELLEDYEGVFMLEYHHHRYRPQAREILEAARGYVKRHSS